MVINRWHRKLHNSFVVVWALTEFKLVAYARRIRRVSVEIAPYPPNTNLVITLCTLVRSRRNLRQQDRIIFLVLHAKFGPILRKSNPTSFCGPYGPLNGQFFARPAEIQLWTYGWVRIEKLDP
ncbi:hypothetical protein M6B38_105350 [Iris pallida]|uniref:Uncharacterized protein n=1 Tax=Iris pallida TaxID=29817 RepID=A0AAX6ES62_IRIPA|nr:hypothetical protein M6B38_105350 [Iris pallida]